LLSGFAAATRVQEKCTPRLKLALSQLLLEECASNFVFGKRCGGCAAEGWALLTAQSTAASLVLICKQHRQNNDIEGVLY
jgi:hypothetical protein